MKSEKQQLFESLLDLHLDRLEGQARESLEAACREDPELAAACDRVGEILQPLDQWGAASPSPNLADRVLSHIGERSAAAALTPGLPSEPASRRRWPFVSLREPLAVAACIALLLGAFFPGVSALRHNSRKALCSDNLRSIYSGTAMYQASFGGALPYAGRVPGASWLPTGKPPASRFTGSPVGDGGQAFASNSRHIYLLVKMDFGPRPCDFVCPGGASGKPMDSTQLAKCKDFERACNISYASMNLSGSAPSLRPTRTLAYLGDANPLFVNARFDASVDPDRANSRAHGGKGQMILMLDGTARWLTTPVYGTQKDNVWLAGNIRHYTGLESPIGSDDVQLVPGYPVTDRAYYGKRVAH